MALKGSQGDSRIAPPPPLTPPLCFRTLWDMVGCRHKESKMVRILMRQEKTMKVICNHVADPRIVLKPNAGSDRSWVWNAYDFTEGKLEETTFALRFANSDSANEFLEVSLSLSSRRGEEEEEEEEDRWDSLSLDERGE